MAQLPNGSGCGQPVSMKQGCCGRHVLEAATTCERMCLCFCKQCIAPLRLEGNQMNQMLFSGITLLTGNGPSATKQ